MCLYVLDFEYFKFVAAIFRSLLHEACGRIVNPIYGSVGLLWSGSWQLCQAAVDAVLKGEAITPIATDTTTANGQCPPIKVYDIRHISKEENSAADGLSHHRKRYKTRQAKRVEKYNEASHESSLSDHSEDESNGKETTNCPVELELKLGIEPVLSRENHVVVPVKKRRMGVFRTCQVEEDTCKQEG